MYQVCEPGIVRDDLIYVLMREKKILTRTPHVRNQTENFSKRSFEIRRADFRTGVLCLRISVTELRSNDGNRFYDRNLIGPYDVANFMFCKHKIVELR